MLTFIMRKDGGNHKREQFPLSEAYGITIHKAQGLTLQMVAIDLDWQGPLKAGAYVALSRATALTGVFAPLQQGLHRLGRGGAPAVS